MCNNQASLFCDYNCCSTTVCLLGGLGDGGGALEPGLPLVRDTGQQLLDLGDGLTGVEALGARLGTVHNGVTSKQK